MTSPRHSAALVQCSIFTTPRTAQHPLQDQALSSDRQTKSENLVKWWPGLTDRPVRAIRSFIAAARQGVCCIEPSEMIWESATGRSASLTTQFSLVKRP